MTKLTCVSANCQGQVMSHSLRVQQRKCVGESHFCLDHGRAFIGDYDSKVKTGTPGIARLHENGFFFEIVLLYCEDGPQGPWQVWLEEVDGNRRVTINTGPFEWGALARVLQRRSLPRPLTHRAMASIIAALGGQVQHILIDKYYATEQIFEAKLHIQQMNATVVVDVRPSDAVVLAAICDVPIIVSNDVLTTLANAQQ